MEAIESAALRCGYLGGDAVFVGGGIVAQRDVLPGANLFLRAVESGLDEDIAIFLSATRATDMRLRKTRHGFGHWSPTGIRLHATVRPWFHHAEGHRRSGEGAPHTHTAYARVNILPLLRQQANRQGAETQEKDNETRFCHSQNIEWFIFVIYMAKIRKVGRRAKRMSEFLFIS